EGLQQTFRRCAMTLKVLSPLAAAQFRSRLQQYAYRVGITCALETGGKLAPESAFAQLEALWQTLQQEATALGIPDEDG
ncbi:hypothetical protein, partial [Synechococcus sp. R60.3]|uniref:DUF7219 family protein n=2 Tax=Synechococcus TaxID=1129 RepID=UPI0039C2B4F8